MTFEEAEHQANVCTKCRLHASRTQVVFGEGNLQSSVIFIGEGPGEVEDATGRPFVGPAGQKLTEILESAGIARESVYIGNMVKCRPPGNRAPQKDEIETCWPYLEAQIRRIKPKIVVALGNVPAQYLLKTTEGITTLRGRFFPWRDGIEIYCMFHPSYLLRNPSREPGSPKYLTWQDIKRLKERLDGLQRSAKSE
ncbi:uracil-DNA glycosylase [Candidatus Acetothermia bacterium]|nr:uracil-DNA glycosylase [Candidatus Acetothermia bacterium]MCI2431616.1 uracil-DNA glycosylase [Candidatus Acetothermia bacterium]MCI2436472.1 uracil-DNA glycosylase [Candidatus Acetothermia bacterium]